MSALRDDLIEFGARALCAERGYDPDRKMPKKVGAGFRRCEIGEPLWKEHTRDAAIVLDVVFDYQRRNLNLCKATERAAVTKLKTADELPADFGKINGEDHPDSIIADAATKAERERCAKIAEGFKLGVCGDDKYTARYCLAESIAAAIRQSVQSN